jgi:hypothetical protein|nr:MAG TPA: hypothetical protein [Caudoviricetes sp.]
MTVREKLEREMDKEEVKRWEEENADVEKFDKDNIPGNNDATGSAGSD